MGIATRHISPQIALSAVLFIGLAAIAYHALNDQLLKAFLVVLIPIAIIYIILSIKRPLIALITYYIPDLKIKMFVSFLVVLSGICMIRMGIIQKKR